MIHTLSISTPTDRDIVLTRVFNAPRVLVFDCWTRPELLKRWMLGPPGTVFEVCDIDLRVGGGYRFVWRSPDGSQLGMRGVYREIAPPERISDTQQFDEDWTGGETEGTLVLIEASGVTTATNTLRYASRDARDGALRSGMEHGMAAGYDRLDDVLTSMD